MQDEPFRLPTVWPRPHDSGAADRLIERFGDIGRAEGRLAASPAVTALLRSLGGNSPYLADLAVRESATLRAIVATGPDQVVAAALNELASVTPQTRRDRVAAAMRRAKRVVALATAIADIGGIWPLERITGTLSVSDWNTRQNFTSGTDFTRALPPVLTIRGFPVNAAETNRRAREPKIKPPGSPRVQGKFLYNRV